MPRNKRPASLNTKNPEVSRAAARLAKLQGTTLTDAVLNAVHTELSRHEVHLMEEFALRISELPLLDARSEDEILGYGPEGYLIGG